MTEAEIPLQRITIEYQDIGRERWSGKITYSRTIERTPDDIAELACTEASKHLYSNAIDATYNPETNQGRIFVGGTRQVGRFKVAE